MAHADDQSRLAAARSVVEVSKATDTMKQMFPTMLAQIRPVLAKQGADQQTIDDLLARFSRKLEDNLPKFADLVAQTYAREFSEEDLNNLITFYRSKTGQNLVSKQPVINQSVTVLGTQWGQEITGEVLQEYLQDQMAKAKTK